MVGFRLFPLFPKIHYPKRKRKKENTTVPLFLTKKNIEKMRKSLKAKLLAVHEGLTYKHEPRTIAA